MMPARLPDRLIDRLPPVRGRLDENVPLASIAWFRVGGPAEVMFRPADRDDLCAFLSVRPADVPVTAVGLASNLLIRDGGGSLRMNAGAYGREMADVVIDAEAVAGDGTVHRRDAAAFGFAYRHCGVPQDWIFTEARLRADPGTPGEIAGRMSRIAAARKESQPIRMRTGGSTFKNPPGLKAWELIDGAGCRGLVRGGAQVSPMHCNFLINNGGATAADLEGLGEDVRRRVLEKFGVALEWEIERIGVPREGGR